MIYLILLLALGLRLWNINQSLWLDEAAQVIESSYSIPQMLDALHAVFHPPLFHLIFHYWLFLGKSELIMRFLPVSFGILSIFISYLFTQKLFNKKAALITALLLAINPFHIYFSQELRPYMASVFFAMLNIYLLWLALYEDKKNWPFFFLSSILLAYSTYFAVFILLAEAFYIIFFFKRKRELAIFITNLLVVFVSFLPWIIFEIPEQLRISSGIARDLPGWSNAVSTPVLKVIPLTLVKFIIGQINFSPTVLYGIISVICLTIWGYLFFKSISFKNKGWLYVLTLFLGGLIVPAIFSFFLQIAAPKRLIYLLPLIIILISLGITKLKGLQFYVFLFLVIIISLSCVLIYETNPKFQREDWRSSVEKINSLAPQGDSAVFFKFSGVFAPYLFYQKNTIPIFGLADNLQVSDKSLKEKIDYLPNTIFVYEYLGELTDPNKLTERKLQELGYQKRDTFDFSGVGLVDYYRSK